MSFIPYGRQSIEQADIDAVVEVLRSDFLTQGPAVPRFEEAIASSCKASHAVACSSGTAALHLACLALGVGPGDRVWTSAISFVASANCARYCGADVDFIDVDPRSGLIDIDLVEEKLRHAEQQGVLPKVVIPVHLAGLPCDMERLASLAHQYGFSVIEDASHALGASIDDAPIGNNRYSDACVFSFHPVKLITTGEGGVVTTANHELAQSMQRFRSHGITRDQSEMTGPSHGPWYYQQLELGFNYRMTDLQAALGQSQLSKLDQFIERRDQLARIYDQAFTSLPLEQPVRYQGRQSAWHLYSIRLRDASVRKAVFCELRQKDIGVNVHYIPIPMQPYYQQLGYTTTDLPGAVDYYHRAISLPLHPQLTHAEQSYVIEAVSEALACRS